VETMTWLTDAVTVATSVFTFLKANPEIFLPAVAVIVFGLAKQGIRAVKTGGR